MRIVFWGNFGIGNLGNECTLQAIAQCTKAYVPDADLACVCAEPEDVGQRHRMTAEPFRRSTRGALPTRSAILRVLRRLIAEPSDWLRALAFLRGADLLMVAGTGIVTDCRERSFGLPYELLRWCLAARIRGARVVFVSVGVESIGSPVAKLLLRGALGLAAYRSYRDQQSLERLREEGFRVSSDAVFPDLAFSLRNAGADRRGGVPGRPRVAVGVWDYRDGEVAGGLSYRNYIQRIADFVCWLIQRGSAVRVLVGDFYADERVRQDVRLELLSRGVHPEVAELSDPPAASVAELLSQMADVDFVVATRFHHLVLSLSEGRPALALSYEQKIEALLADFGLDWCTQSVWDFTVERLTQQFEALEQSGPETRKRVLERAEQHRRALDEQYRRIFGVGAMGKRSPDTSRAS